MSQFPIARTAGFRLPVHLVIPVAITLSCTAGCSCSREQPIGADGDGRMSAGAQVVALGRVEPRDGVVDLHGLAGDRLERLDATVGKDVEQGDVLAVYESRGLKELEYRSWRAQVHELETRFAAEIKLADARIARAERALERAEQSQPDPKALAKKIGLAAANSETAKKHRAWLASVGEDLIPEQQMDKQHLLVEKAELDLTAAQAEFDQAERESRLAVTAAKAELAMAEAAKEQALAALPDESQQVALKLAEKQLDLTQLLAPHDGTVLRVFTKPGETMGQTPILQMANLKQMVVVAEVYETNVKRLRLGQKATVRSKALRAPYDEQGLQGTVEQIGRMISTPALKNLDPFAPADRRVMEIRIQLDDDDACQAAEFVGLQVEVTFSD